MCALFTNFVPQAPLESSALLAGEKNLIKNSLQQSQLTFLKGAGSQSDSLLNSKQPTGLCQHQADKMTETSEFGKRHGTLRYP